MLRKTMISVVAMVCAHAVAQPLWDVVKPSTTGIPGEEVRVARFAPDGRLWVGARWPFWTEGGIGIHDLSAGTWEVWSNVPDSSAGGFPSAFVNDIEFAPDGTVWAATSDGLAHFVRGAWELYTSANTPMPYHNIRAIDLDSRGRVWINARRGPSYINAAVFVFDGQTWQSWSVGNGIPWPSPWEELNGMLVDRRDRAWVGNTTQSGLAEFDGNEWRIHTAAGIPPLRGPLEDSFGNIWAISENLGYSFYRFDGARWEEFSSANTPFVQTTITALAEDDHQRLLVSNWAGQVIRQTSAGASTFELIANIGIRAYNLNPRPNEDLYLTSPGAVRHLDPSGNQIRAFNTYNTGMQDYFMDRFDVDREGNLWFASGEGGLSRFDGVAWRNWGAHNAGSEPYPFAGNEPMGGFYLDDAGAGWMGGNGIARWDPASGRFTGFWNWQNNPGMGVTLFTHFAQDMHGNLFASTRYNAVFRFDGALWVQEPPIASRLHTDSAGNVYAAGRWDIHVWDGSAWSGIPLPHSGYLFDLGGVSAFAAAPDGTLWIGTNKGLVRHAGSGFTLFDTSNSPLPAEQVQGVDVGAGGALGLSAHTFGSVTPFPSGVAVIRGDPADPANWSVYGYGTDPIPHYQLGPVKFDAEGNLWISAVSEGCAVLLGADSPCYPDCDGDGRLDFFDFLCFQNRFLAGDPYADCDGNSMLDFFDFLCFQNEFLAGCP